MHKIVWARILTYAGALPFLICALGPILYASEFDYGVVMRAYGAIIVSFISGIHWGVYLWKDAPVNLFITSNVSALFAWGSLFTPTLWGLGILGVCFLYLLAVDRFLRSKDALPLWFYILRVRITIIVLAAFVFYGFTSG